MAAEWELDSLENVIDIRHGYAFEGEMIHSEARGDVLLTPGNFAIGGGFKRDKFKYFDGPVPDEYVLQEGDLIVTMTDLSKQGDTLGYPAFVPSPPAGRRYLHNQRLGKVLVTKPNAVDVRYLHYLMCTAEYRHEVLSSATGTTVRHTSPDRIRHFPFRRPPLPEQRIIGHVLGTLDDKIELNRRMNQTLEGIARALFRSWFVDFDPVRAKAMGRDTGLPVHIADLFPDRLEPSELGKIPAGWTVNSLGRLFGAKSGCVLTGPFGSKLHASDYREEGVPLILVKHVLDGRILEDDLPLVGAHKAGELERYRLEKEDIVFTRVGAVGRSAYISSRQAGWIFSGQTLRVRVPGTNQLGPRFLAQRYLEKSFIEMVEGYALGTTRPSLNTALLLSFEFVLPPFELQKIFGTIADSIDGRAEATRQESRTLAELRDALVPKLISGEVRVKDAERFVGEAV